MKSFHEKPLPTHEKTALNKYDQILSPFLSQKNLVKKMTVILQAPHHPAAKEIDILRWSYTEDKTPHLLHF